jgi:hypothetical protein
MGCDIHYSIERVSEQYYRKNKINKLVGEDKDKLSFKEYCQEEKNNNIKQWTSIYIEWFDAINKYGCDDEYDEEDKYEGYVSDEERCQIFRKLGYKNDKNLDLDINRNYILFGILGDARNFHKTVVPISAYRNIPEDVSEATKYFNEHIWSHDAHSHSWISLKEIVDYGKEKWYEMECANFWNKIVTYMLSLNLPHEDVRIVFWFDN